MPINSTQRGLVTTDSHSYFEIIRPVLLCEELHNQELCLAWAQLNNLQYLKKFLLFILNPMNNYTSILDPDQLKDIKIAVELLHKILECNENISPEINFLEKYLLIDQASKARKGDNDLETLHHLINKNLSIPPVIKSNIQKFIHHMGNSNELFQSAVADIQSKYLRETFKTFTFQSKVIFESTADLNSFSEVLLQAFKAEISSRNNVFRFAHDTSEIVARRETSIATSREARKVLLTTIAFFKEESDGKQLNAIKLKHEPKSEKTSEIKKEQKSLNSSAVVLVQQAPSSKLHP